jgi:hypothetical protein
MRASARLTLRLVSSKKKAAELALVYTAMRWDGLRSYDEARDECRCGVVVVDGGWRQSGWAF